MGKLSSRFRLVAVFFLVFIALASRPSACFSAEPTPIATERTVRTKGNSRKPPIQYEKTTDDDFFRYLRHNTPLKFQYFLRDSGLLRFLVDTLTLTTAVPAIVREYPQAVARFWYLSGFPLPLVSLANTIWNKGGSSGKRVDLRRMGEMHESVDFANIRYGLHPRQTMDVIKLQRAYQFSSWESGVVSSRLVLFVHGGAWGSGTKEVYRCVASPFLERGTTVAVLGYRTYPDGYARDQADDVVQAVRKLKAEDLIGNHTQLALMGHSSGAHVSAMAVLSDVEVRESVNVLIALAGVYDIPRHYQYERLRGVERISPMAAACAAPSCSLLQASRRQSPTWVAESSDITQLTRFPDTLVLHGEDDTTVPTEPTARFVDALRGTMDGPTATSDIDLVIQPEIGHVDIMTQLMFGGTSRDVILGWMEDKDYVDVLKNT